MPATPFRSYASISRRLADAERRSLDAAVDRPTRVACFRSPAARFQPAGATRSGRSATRSGRGATPNGRDTTRSGHRVTPSGHGATLSSHGATPSGHGATPSSHGATPSGHADAPSGLGSCRPPSPSEWRRRWRLTAARRRTATAWSRAATAPRRIRGLSESRRRRFSSTPSSGGAVDPWPCGVALDGRCSDGEEAVDGP
jgi:hypothetical protein